MYMWRERVNNVKQTKNNKMDDRGTTGLNLQDIKGLNNTLSTPPVAM